MADKKRKANWKVTFDVSPDTTIGPDNRPGHRATALVQRGEVAFVAEVELVNWAEDIAAFFARARQVFFEAEAGRLPEFPDLSETPAQAAASGGEAQPAEEADPQETPTDPDALVEAEEAPTADDTPAETQATGEAAPDYDITCYDPDEPETTVEAGEVAGIPWHDPDGVEAGEATQSQPGLF